MLKVSDEIADDDLDEYIDDELGGESNPDNSGIDDDIYDINRSPFVLIEFTGTGSHGSSNDCGNSGLIY